MRWSSGAKLSFGIDHIAGAERRIGWGRPAAGHLINGGCNDVPRSFGGVVD